MKQGDLVEVCVDSCAIWADGSGEGRGKRVGTVGRGERGVILQSRTNDPRSTRSVTHCQVDLPERGPVWIIGTWLSKVE